MPVTIDRTDVGSFTNSATSYSFPDRIYSAEDSVAVVAFMQATGGTPGISSVSINGSAADGIVSTTGNAVAVCLAYRQLSAVDIVSDEIDVVVTVPSAAARGAMALYKVLGSALPIFASANPAGGGDATRSFMIDVPADGAIIAASYERSGTTAWTGVTSDVDQDPGAGNGDTLGVGLLETSSLLSGLTVEAANDSRALVGISFAPFGLIGRGLLRSSKLARRSLVA